MLLCIWVYINNNTSLPSLYLLVACFPVPGTTPSPDFYIYVDAFSCIGRCIVTNPSLDSRKAP